MNNEYFLDYCFFYTWPPSAQTVSLQPLQELPLGELQWPQIDATVLFVSGRDNNFIAAKEEQIVELLLVRFRWLLLDTEVEVVLKNNKDGVKNCSETRCFIEKMVYNSAF